MPLADVDHIEYGKNYTTGYTERLVKERDRLRRLARDLVDAVKSSEPEAISNDLGNALAAMEDELK
jgi:hypothetical protein